MIAPDALFSGIHGGGSFVAAGGSAARHTPVSQYVCGMPVHVQQTYANPDRTVRILRNGWTDVVLLFSNYGGRDIFLSK
ncbi:hypothetical protein [Roseovarius indicus]|uniref:hypothetical protein n=1 Tax=Roseovarius indicus TaxID=540747 RepID=UPI0032EB31A0